MALGNTLVLINHDNMYEALYDVLNQRYVTQRNNKTGVETRMLRVAVGMRSALCPVHDDFKLICLVEDTHAYEKLDLPLLNRFEKQFLVPDTVLSDGQKELIGVLRSWVGECIKEVPELKRDEVFCGFDDNASLATLVLSLQLTGSDDNSFAVAKEYLMHASTPLAMMKSSRMAPFKETYFRDQSSFLAFCRAQYLEKKDQYGQYHFVSQFLLIGFVLFLVVCKKN